MPTTTIEDKFRAWLATVPAVAALATPPERPRVYPFGEVPESPAWPFLTYYRVHGPRLRSLRGPSGVSHPTVQVGCHAKSYVAARTLADAVRIAVDGFGRGDMGGLFVQCMIAGDDRDGGPADGGLGPVHGDDVAQPCVSIDVTIWFQEG